MAKDWAKKYEDKQVRWNGQWRNTYDDLKLDWGNINLKIYFNFDYRIKKFNFKLLI